MRLRIESNMAKEGEWWCVFQHMQVHSPANGAVAFTEGRVTFRLVQVADAWLLSAGVGRVGRFPWIVSALLFWENDFIISWRPQRHMSADTK